MKSLHLRLTLWFAISFFCVVTLLVLSAYWHLDHELRKEKWERAHPGHQDWTLHASFSDDEVRDILDELIEVWLIIGVPLAALATGLAYLVARRSVRPVRRINEQLVSLDVRTLSKRIDAPDVDPHIRELVAHFNQLLARLESSFGHLQEYTSQVAHELRTPLQLMRLQIEANAAAMKPDLAESLQDELARLSNYVETALTIARAEQGRLELSPESILFKDFLADLLEPFGRLAVAEQRRLLWSCPANVVVHADRDTLKQMLVNLLANALKHGENDIFLRVRANRRAATLLLGNRAAHEAPAAAKGLGIGLRLVHALVQLMPGARVQMRRHRFFWVRLQLPTTHSNDQR